MLEDYKDSRVKSQSRIMQEKIERERAAFLNKESVLTNAERQPLSQIHQLDSYEAVQRRLE